MQRPLRSPVSDSQLHRNETRALSLTPLTCVRPAHGGGGGPPPPPATFPAYFIHTGHLGSTVMLSCFLQDSSCPDHTPAQYIRYDAYGLPKVFAPGGYAVSPALTDRLYTGQRWDATTRLYDYGARWYDPQLARFTSQDPVREYMNPYAYVKWNPVKFVDPTGMDGVLWGGPLGFSSLGYNGDDSVGKFAAAAAALITGSASVGANFGGPSAGFGFGGAGSDVGLAVALQVAGLDADTASYIESTVTGFDQSVSALGMRFGGAEPAWAASLPGQIAGWLGADLHEAAGFLYGTTYLLGRGVLRIGAGIGQGNLKEIGLGLYDLVTAPLPKAGSATGLNYDQSYGFGPTGTMLDNGGIDHDDLVSAPGGFQAQNGVRS